MTIKILQIVPRLPPIHDGIGDYSLSLAKALHENHEIDSYFLAMHQNAVLSGKINGFPVSSLSVHDENGLLSAVPEDIDCILLQYGNYPYVHQKWTAPFWLQKALKSIVSRRKLKLIVMFHELPFLKWKNVRFINPIHFIVTRHLAEISKNQVTNNAKFQSILKKKGFAGVSCLPNFSNVGELESPNLLKNRKNIIVVFGGTDRDRVYKNSLSQILDVCNRYKIEALYDIGQPLNLAARYDFKSVNLIEMGFQSASVVSDILSQALFCCLDYTRFPGNMGKSSVFAAACSHGLVTLCTDDNLSDLDGIVAGKNYLLINQSSSGWTEDYLQEIASCAHRWYQSHDLKNNAQKFAALMLGGASRP